MSQDGTKLVLCLGLALCLVIISIFIGPMISKIGNILTGEKITTSEATSYFLQAFLAIVIAFALT